jgi:hypothetical protein
MNVEDLKLMLLRVLNITAWDSDLQLTLSNHRYVVLVPAPALRKLAEQYKDIKPLEKVYEIGFDRQLTQIEYWWEEDDEDREILTLAVDHVDDEELHCCLISNEGWMRDVLLIPNKVIF